MKNIWPILPHLLNVVAPTNTATTFLRAAEPVKEEWKNYQFDGKKTFVKEFRDALTNKDDQNTTFGEKSIDTIMKLSDYDKKLLKLGFLKPRISFDFYGEAAPKMIQNDRSCTKPGSSTVDIALKNNLLVYPINVGETFMVSTNSGNGGISYDYQSKIKLHFDANYDLFIHLYIEDTASSSQHANHNQKVKQYFGDGSYGYQLSNIKISYEMPFAVDDLNQWIFVWEYRLEHQSFDDFNAWLLSELQRQKTIQALNFFDWCELEKLSSEEFKKIYLLPNLEPTMIELKFKFKKNYDVELFKLIKPEHFTFQIRLNKVVDINQLNLNKNKIVVDHQDQVYAKFKANNNHYLKMLDQELHYDIIDSQLVIKPILATNFLKGEIKIDFEIQTKKPIDLNDLDGNLGVIRADAINDAELFAKFKAKNILKIPQAQQNDFLLANNTFYANSSQYIGMKKIHYMLIEPTTKLVDLASTNFNFDFGDFVIIIRLCHKYLSLDFVSKIITRW
ncbi:hypothetical protein [Williamsoniiplasma lucivorax]|uniref:Uncharacterized protein n=1 Tax=Williamsoniiplasma lucivorax TaxID=209274 RepID=A0A2S5RFS6_9MOLU|nr:hypothetical protein [Williamsoniiplasma lucivorax]PPE06163.1 hypothetical protein ELUCI_v1c04540 [Williamsoniiplasma lucivorax]